MNRNFPEFICNDHSEGVRLYSLACSLALENIAPWPERPGWRPPMTCPNEITIHLESTISFSLQVMLEGRSETDIPEFSQFPDI